MYPPYFFLFLIFLFFSSFSPFSFFYSFFRKALIKKAFHACKIKAHPTRKRCAFWIIFHLITPFYKKMLENFFLFFILFLIFLAKKYLFTILFEQFELKHKSHLTSLRTKQFFIIPPPSTKKFSMFKIVILMI